MIGHERSTGRRGSRVARVAIGTGMAGAMLAAGVSATGAQSAHHGVASLTPLRLVYDWPGMDFEAVPFVAAQKLGYYKSAGLDVSIVLPPDNSTTVKMLALNKGDIGFDTTTDVVFARDAGIPIVSIANYSQNNDWGLVAPPGKKIDIHALKGKSIGIFTDSWTTAMMPYVLKAAGATASQVKETVFSSNDIAPMLSGHLDIATNTLNYAVAEVEDGTGKKPSTLLATSFGAPNIPIWVFTATSTWLQSHGSEAKGFLAATRKGFQYAIAHPAEATAWFVGAYPKNGSSPKYNVAGWEQTIPALGNPQSLMVQSKSEWTEVPKALMAVKLLKEAQPASNYYTNKYLGG